MTENQKLREALQVAHDHIDMWSLEISHCKDAALIREALALPTADHLPDAGEMIQTAAPVGEREAFEQFAQNCPMGKYNVTRRGEGYDSSHTQIMWDAWQARSARAALSAGDAVDAQRLDFIEMSARCDPKMDGQHVWWPTSLNKALKGPTLRDAIDAAMRKAKP